MTYVDQLHAVIDRIAEADARRDAAVSDRADAIDELRDLLEHEQPGQVTDGLRAAGAQPPAPVSTIPCPECDFTSRTTAGLAVHRRKRHGVIGTSARPPVAAAKNGHPSRREQFLCSRCPESFLSREERDAHQAAHPEIPAAPVLRHAGEGAHAAGLGE